MSDRARKGWRERTQATAEDMVIDLDGASSAKSMFGRAFEVVQPLPTQNTPDLDLLLMKVESTTRRTRLAKPLNCMTAPEDLANLNVAFEASLPHIRLATQPIVSWSQCATVAWEALLRSDAPSLRSPTDLFDAATRLDRVRELSRAVRVLASTRVGELPAGTRLFVNLATEDLLDEDLFDASSALSRLAHRVVLEVNEGARLEEITDLQDRITHLRRLGFMIAVDDFGAGYATFQSVSKLNPDVVKLDMSLIRGLDTDPRRGRLIRSVVELCHGLGVSVICEGVELPEEVEGVLEAGCDLLQGYAFGMPSRELILASTKISTAHHTFDERPTDQLRPRRSTRTPSEETPLKRRMAPSNRTRPIPRTEIER